MALWRDPLDELITDLEQTVPSVPAPALAIAYYQATLIGLQIWAGAVFSGDPEQLARAERDERVRLLLADLERVAALPR